MRIKVCGITNVNDAREALALGAWALGFNFYHESPRYIAPAIAAEIIAQLPRSIIPIGVFVNMSADQINIICQQTAIQIIQLHGDETIEFAQQFPLPVIKAIRKKLPDQLNAFKHLQKFHAVLVDAADSTQYGGTGQIADWQFAQQLARTAPVILAGGLTSKNISAAIATVQPVAVDVCSGVEESPGYKSKEKLSAFFSAANSLRGAI